VPQLSSRAREAIEHVEVARQHNPATYRAAVADLAQDQATKAELDAFTSAVQKRFGREVFLSAENRPERLVAPAERAVLEAQRPMLAAVQRIAREERTLRGLALGRAQDRGRTR
jgi:hypothetical protein